MNFLFLSGYTHDVNKANQKIVDLLAQELVRRRNKVTVYLIGEEPKVYNAQGVVYKVLENTRSVKFKKSHPSLWQLFDYELQAFGSQVFFPNRDFYSSIIEFKAYMQLREQYDCVIAFVKPFFTAATLHYIKRIDRKKICVAYIMDIYDGSELHRKDKKVNKRLEFYYRREIRKLYNLDCILVPEKGYSKYKRLYKSENYPEVVMMDFPTLVKWENNQKPSDYDNNKNCRVFLLYGSLEEQLRNPTTLLELMNEISVTNNINVIFYCTGCGNLLSKYSKNKRFYINEPVKYEVLKQQIYQADVLLNISNESNIMVPSKLFELFSTGKPIVDFSKNGINSSKTYLEKYPNVLRIFSEDPLPLSIKKFNEWYSSADFAPVNYGIIEKIYIKNTASFAADTIESLTNKRGGRI